MPGAVGVNEPDVTVFVAVGSVTVDVKIGAPVHVALFGPNSVNVTLAPACGLTRPLTVALSVIEPPSVTGVTASVMIVGVACVTTVCSLASLQAPVTGRCSHRRCRTRSSDRSPAPSA